MKTQPTRKPPRLHPNIWSLTLTSFLTDISSEMLFNILPLFLFNVLGVSTAVVGLIEGVAETTSSFLKLISGVLSDRTQKLKMMTVFGYTISAMVKPLFFFASSWVWVLGIRFSDRVGKGIRTAPRDALLAASVEPERRGFAFGFHRAGDTAGAFIGLGIATLIISASQSGIAELTGTTFRYIVLASIIPGVLAVLILAMGTRDITLQTEERKPLNLRRGSLNKHFVRFVIVVIIFTFGNSSDAFIILRGQERGLSVMQVMGMLLTFTAVYSLLSGPAGSLSDRFGRRRVVLVGWLIYSLIYFGFALARTGIQVWILYGLYGIYYAMTEGASRAFVADLVPLPQRGTAFGVYHAAVGFSALPASIIAGILWQGLGKWSGFGPSAPFFSGAIFAALAGVLLMTWVRS